MKIDLPVGEFTEPDDHLRFLASQLRREDLFEVIEKGKDKTKLVQIPLLVLESVADQLEDIAAGLE